MKLLYFSLSILLFTFQGCTTKEATPQSNTHQTKTEITTSSNLQNNISGDKETESKTQEAENEFEEEFSAQERNDTIDPLSGYNRAMTSFNDKVIMYGLNPISEAYAYILPQPFRLGISNFVHNIQFPIRFTNNLLQGKFQNSSNELERFIVNSTVGLGGLMDPAKNYMNIHPHDEDFGQTLGHYGVGFGFHIVLPFLGPSNVRDVVGFVIDGYTSPLVYIENLKKYKIPNNRDQSLGIIIVDVINKTSLHLGEYEDLKKDAIDLYPFFRDTYEQKRNSDIAE